MDSFKFRTYSSYNLNGIHDLFNDLSLVRSVPNFPIECQMMKFLLNIREYFNEEVLVYIITTTERSLTGRMYPLGGYGAGSSPAFLNRNL